MGLKDFAVFNQLYKSGHKVKDMGLVGNAGDVTRLSYRVKLAKSFQGIVTDQISARTLAGYNGFFQVFLTHCALERYVKITKQSVDGMEEKLKALGSGDVMKEILNLDPKRKLVGFLKKWVNRSLNGNLAQCEAGASVNVGYLSESIRHIFAHGHLTANANGINPTDVHKICKMISTLILSFIDDDFSKKIEKYRKSLK